MHELISLEAFNASGRKRSARGLGQRSGAVFGVVATLVLALAAPADALSTVNPGNPIAGDGTSSATPFVYEVELDCVALQESSGNTELMLASSASAGRWYEIRVTVKSGTQGSCQSTGSFRLHYSDSADAGPGTEGPVVASSGVYSKTFLAEDTGQGMSRVEIDSVFIAGDADASPPVVTRPRRRAAFIIQVGEISASGMSSSGILPDPRDATVAVVAEQVAAAGVEGSANGVRVRGSEVLPVTSRLSSAVGPRGGVVLSSDELEVRVASVLGARADAGVLVPSSGMFEVSVTGPLAPGSVVEAWINSQPRLVAAAEVPEDGATTIVIPTGTPLDGGEAIEDGAHTLELRMYTADGFEVVATGITVGSPVPSGVPAGEGGLPVGAGLLVLLGAAGAALVAGRRLVTAG